MSKKQPSRGDPLRPSPRALDPPRGGRWAENGRQEAPKIDKSNEKEQVISEKPYQNRCRKRAKKYAPGLQKDAQMESKVENVVYLLEKGEKCQITLPLRREHDSTGLEDTNK